MPACGDCRCSETGRMPLCMLQSQLGQRDHIEMTTSESLAVLHISCWLVSPSNCFLLCAFPMDLIFGRFFFLFNKLCILSSHSHSQAFFIWDVSKLPARVLIVLPRIADKIPTPKAKTLKVWLNLIVFFHLVVLNIAK